MFESYKVFPDKVRVYTTGLIFTVFAVAFLAVLLAKTWFILKAFAVLFALMFGYLAFRTFKKAFQKEPEYVIDSQGVTDYTREDTITLPWNDIMKIEMVPNNAVMEIGILANNAMSDKDQQGDALKDNLKNNGNIAFYTIMIDGFNFRRKQFTGIFKELERQGAHYNPQILISEYIDPETKRKMADKREAIQRAQRRQRKMERRQLAGKQPSRWKFW